MALIDYGRMHGYSFATDPKHVGFVHSRYHFVARMLHGKKMVLEVGAGEGVFSAVVAACVGHVLLSDSVPQDDVVAKWDAVKGGPLGGYAFDAVYMLDVLEHIRAKDEDRALANICSLMTDDGVLIVGTPSRESQPHASALSRQHHVNCKTEKGLRETLKRHFDNVFLFGMNDATLHTGYGPMCHYRLAVCTGKRDGANRL